MARIPIVDPTANTRGRARRKSLAIGGAQDIRNVDAAVSRDPGVAANPDAFGGGIGDALATAGSAIFQIGERQRREDEAINDANATTDAKIQFDRAVSDELDRANKAGSGIADIGGHITGFQDQTRREIIGQLGDGVSDRSRASIDNSLKLRGHNFSETAKTVTRQNQVKRANDLIGQSMSIAVQGVRNNADSLDEALAGVDETLAGYADVFSADGLRDTKRGYQQALIMAAFETRIKGDDMEGAGVLIGRMQARAIETRDPDGFPINLTTAPVKNADGSFSFEGIKTVRLNGRFYNIPTIWNGKRLSVEQSTELAAAAIDAGAEFPNYDSMDRAQARAKIRTKAVADARKRSSALPVGREQDKIVKGIIRIESNFDPLARTPIKGQTAGGLGGFTDGTWLEAVKEHAPELLKGRTRAEVIALKFDGPIAEKILAAFTRENQKFLDEEKLPVTPGTTYLAHFLGRGGALKVLRADRNASIEPIVGPKAVKFNQSILKGRTVGQVIAWAEGKMGAKSLAGFLTPEQQSKMSRTLDRARATSETEHTRRSNKQQADRFDALLLALHEGKADVTDIRDARENGTITSLTALNKAEKAHQDRLETEQNFQRFQSIMAGEGTIDASNPDDKKTLNSGFRGMMGDGNDAFVDLGERNQAAADVLFQLADQTDAIPSDAASMLSAQMRSKDAEVMLFAYQTASRLQRRNPRAFAQAFNEQDERLTALFSNQAGFAETGKIMERLAAAREPRTKEQNDLLDGQADEFLKGISAETIADDHFDTVFSSLPTFSRSVQKTAIEAKYRSLFRANFRETGDPETSHTRTAEQLKRVWNVSAVTGRNILMPHPPEAHQPMVGGSHKWMQDQLRKDVESFFKDQGLFDQQQSRSPVREGSAKKNDILKNVVLVPTPKAEDQANRRPPVAIQYWVGVRASNDAIHWAKDKNGAFIDYRFDATSLIEAERKKFARKNAKAKREEAARRQQLNDMLENQSGRRPPLPQ